MLKGFKGDRGAPGDKGEPGAIGLEGFPGDKGVLGPSVRLLFNNVTCVIYI